MVWETQFSNPAFGIDPSLVTYDESSKTRLISLPAINIIEYLAEQDASVYRMTYHKQYAAVYDPQQPYRVVTLQAIPNENAQTCTLVCIFLDSDDKSGPFIEGVFQNYIKEVFWCSRWHSLRLIH